MNEEWFSIFSETLKKEQNRGRRHILEYQKGVSKKEINEAENILGFELPKELKSVLLEFNGIYEYIIDANDKKLQVGSIIWGVAEIVDWHLTWIVPRGLSLFCFGASISGNCFGYLLENGKPKENEIWQSDHETEPPDEITILRASSLKEFITTSLAKILWY